jgi:hypothetical protein
MKVVARLLPCFLHVLVMLFCTEFWFLIIYNLHLNKLPEIFNHGEMLFMLIKYRKAPSLVSVLVLFLVQGLWHFNLSVGCIWMMMLLICIQQAHFYFSVHRMNFTCTRERNHYLDMNPLQYFLQSKNSPCQGIIV